MAEVIFDAEIDVIWFKIFAPLADFRVTVTDTFASRLANCFNEKLGKPAPGSGVIVTFDALNVVVLLVPETGTEPTEPSAMTIAPVVLGASPGEDGWEVAAGCLTSPKSVSTALAS
jgi:hypothetical protein